MREQIAVVRLINHTSAGLVTFQVINRQGEIDF